MDTSKYFKYEGFNMEKTEFFKYEEGYLIQTDGSKDATNILLPKRDVRKLLDRPKDYENLCKSLLRQNKEYKNKMRGIKNPKKNDGFIVLSQRQLTTISIPYQKNVTLWQSVIQTPYDISFTYDQFKKLLDSKMDILFEKLNLHNYLDTNSDVELTLRDKMEEILNNNIDLYEKKNLCLSMNYSMRTSKPWLWDCTLTHSKFINVPQDMWINSPRKEDEEEENNESV